MVKQYFIAAFGVLMGLSAAQANIADSRTSSGNRTKAWSPYIKLSGGVTQATVDGLPSGKQNGSGPIGSLAVGTGYVFSNGMYLGGEAFAGWTRLSIESTLPLEEVDLHVTRKAKESFGGALQVGYAWNLDSLPSLIYVRMGVEKMKWKRHAYATESSLGFYEKIKQDTVKPVFWVPGVGWRHHVSDHWAVSTEYQHALGTGVKKLTRDDKPKWSFQRLMWSISYHF